MPTGYTAELEGMKYDVKRWLKESVARAFGICMHLRDDGKMTQQQIMDSLKKLRKEESYHERRLKEETKELADAMNRTPMDWEKAFYEKLQSESNDYSKRVQEHREKKAAHAQSMAKVTALYNKAVNQNEEELIVNSLKFAVEQLTSAYDFDYGHEPYRPAILDQNPEQWKLATIKAHHDSIVYHTKAIQEEADRKLKHGDPALSYQKLVNFVEKNCE